MPAIEKSVFVICCQCRRHNLKDSSTFAVGPGMLCMSVNIHSDVLVHFIPLSCTWPSTQNGISWTKAADHHAGTQGNDHYLMNMFAQVLWITTLASTYRHKSLWGEVKHLSAMHDHVSFRPTVFQILHCQYYDPLSLAGWYALFYSIFQLQEVTACDFAGCGRSLLCCAARIYFKTWQHNCVPSLAGDHFCACILSHDVAHTGHYHYLHQDRAGEGSEHCWCVVHMRIKVICF